MKRLCYFIVSVCLIALLPSCESTEPEATSQDIYLSRSFKWEIDYVVEDGMSYSKGIVVGKDTLINNRTYRLVDDYYPMRQTKNRIYLYDYKSKKEVLLYDFSLKVGDYIEQLEDPFSGIPKRKAKVIKTETITLADGRKARRIEYEQTYPAPRDPDIEFVGSEQRGILGPLDNSISESSLVAFYEDGTLLYPIKE